MYIAEVVEQLRRQVWEITDEQLAHGSPTGSCHMNPYGEYRFDLARQPGLRPRGASGTGRMYVRTEQEWWSLAKRVAVHQTRRHPASGELAKHPVSGGPNR